MVLVIGNLLFAGLANGSLYALLALGLVLIYKSQDMVNWAHGEFLMAGAFIGYTVYTQLGLPYPVAFAAAVLGGALLGFLIERVLVRPLAHHPHITLAMLTVGISITLRGIARLPFGTDIYAFPPAFGAVPLNIGGLIIAPQSLVNIIAALLLAAIVFAMFAYTSIGRQMRATQSSPTGAAMVGINVNAIYSLTWVIAATVGAIAGFLAAPLTLLYPDMGGSYLLKAFAAAVVGGFGSAPGAIVGGLAIGIVEMLAGGLVSTKLLSIAAYVLIILVMFVRPQGIFGQKGSSRV
jgi:branched-chain amino acid transport system permease protein